MGPAASSGGAGLGVKLFFTLVLIGFLAAGYGGIKTYLDKTQESEALQERGVEADADVSTATEISGRRIETYHELSVFYDPEGPRILEFAVVKDCPGGRWEPGIETVRVVYLPNDPDTIRLAACESSFDVDKLPGIFGLVFFAFALFMLWRLRRLFTG